ncbi:hypothetical protein [Komagataeibacter kakiaceti]|uniref:hypothetical protein n=1 Tax=Komagataeibacter kakiaceti TaxID=943261 RepID=UPI001855D317|nr:hypothetical protein [Komagataeibacter kakiaceti]
MTETLPENNYLIKNSKSFGCLLFSKRRRSLKLFEKSGTRNSPQDLRDAAKGRVFRRPLKNTLAQAIENPREDFHIPYKL